MSFEWHSWYGSELSPFDFTGGRQSVNMDGSEFIRLVTKDNEECFLLTRLKAAGKEGFDLTLCHDGRVWTGQGIVEHCYDVLIIMLYKIQCYREMAAKRTKLKLQKNIRQ